MLKLTRLEKKCLCRKKLLRLLYTTENGSGALTKMRRYLSRTEKYVKLLQIKIDCYCYC